MEGALGEAGQRAQAFLAGEIQVISDQEMGDGKEIFAPDGPIQAGETVGGAAQGGNAGQVGGFLVQEHAVELAFGQERQPGAAQVGGAEQTRPAALDLDVFLLTAALFGVRERTADLEVPEGSALPAGDEDAAGKPDRMLVTVFRG